MGKLSPKLRAALLKSVLEQVKRECGGTYDMERSFADSATPRTRTGRVRAWRFDAAYITVTGLKWAIEVEGLGGSKESEGRHRSIGGFLKDMEKYNEASLLGWRVLRVTWKQVEDGTCLSLLRRACGAP